MKIFVFLLKFHKIDIDILIDLAYCDLVMPYHVMDLNQHWIR